MLGHSSTYTQAGNTVHILLNTTRTELGHRLIDLRFYVPLSIRQVTSETSWYGKT